MGRVLGGAYFGNLGMELGFLFAVKLNMELGSWNLGRFRV